mgnify:FL=1
MTMDLEVRNFLESDPAVQRVSFTMGGTSGVTGAGFRTLADCFSETPIARRIRVTTNPAYVTPHAEAEYSPWSSRRQNGQSTFRDTIAVRSPQVISDPARRQPLLHELTHALFDAHGVPISIRDEESAAYLAGYHIAMHSGTATRADAPAPGDTERTVRRKSAHQEFHDVALAVFRRAPQGQLATVTREERSRLRMACGVIGYRMRWRSGGQTYSADGIGGYVLRNGAWLRR